MTLNEISVKNGTDQGTLGHQYMGLFHLLFRDYKRRNAPHEIAVRILEIGWQWGFSAKSWVEYFQNAIVHGIDIIDNNSPIEGAELFIGDAYNEAIFFRLLPAYDIIIDDDSHFPETQVWFLQHYHKILAPGGIMIVEDVLHKETIPLLKAALPEGFDYTAVDMTEGHSHCEAASRLFIAWKK